MPLDRNQNVEIIGGGLFSGDVSCFQHLLHLKNGKFRWDRSVDGMIEAALILNITLTPTKQEYSFGVTSEWTFQMSFWASLLLMEIFISLAKIFPSIIVMPRMTFEKFIRMLRQMSILVWLVLVLCSVSRQLQSYRRQTGLNETYHFWESGWKCLSSIRWMEEARTNPNHVSRKQTVEIPIVVLHSLYLRTVRSRTLQVRLLFRTNHYYPWRT